MHGSTSQAPRTRVAQRLDHRVDPHHLQRIDLVGDAHRTELGDDPGAYLGGLERARRSVADAAQRYDRLPDEEVLARVPGSGYVLVEAEFCLERFENALRHAERSITIARAAGQRYHTVGLLSAKAHPLMLTGRVAELTAVTEAATEAALLSEGDIFLSLALSSRSHASLLAGDIPSAVRFGERSASGYARWSNPASRFASLRLAYALLLGGEPERRREQLADLEADLRLLSMPSVRAFFNELLVRTELALGDLSYAADLARRSAREAKGLGLEVPLALAHRSLALVALARGDTQSAIADAIASSEAAARVGARLDAAHSRMVAGRAIAAGGDRAAAIAALQSAHEELLSCGAVVLSDEAARELRKLGRVVPRRSGGPDDRPSFPRPKSPKARSHAADRDGQDEPGHR